MFEDIHTFQRGCATIQTSDHCYNNMVGYSVLYDRVLKTKINFETAAGNSKSNKNNNKNCIDFVFISCYELFKNLHFLKNGKSKCEDDIPCFLARKSPKTEQKSFLIL